MTKLHNCQLQHKEKAERMILVDYTPLIGRKLSLRTDGRLSDGVCVRLGGSDVARERGAESSLSKSLRVWLSQPTWPSIVICHLQ